MIKAIVPQMLQSQMNFGEKRENVLIKFLCTETINQFFPLQYQILSDHDINCIQFNQSNNSSV